MQLQKLLPFNEIFIKNAVFIKQRSLRSLVCTFPRMKSCKMKRLRLLKKHMLFPMLTNHKLVGKDELNYSHGTKKVLHLP